MHLIYATVGASDRTKRRGGERLHVIVDAAKQSPAPRLRLPRRCVPRTDMRRLVLSEALREGVTGWASPPIALGGRLFDHSAIPGPILGFVRADRQAGLGWSAWGVTALVLPVGKPGTVSTRLGNGPINGQLTQDSVDCLNKTILPILPILYTMSLTVPIWGTYSLPDSAQGVKPWGEAGGLRWSGKTIKGSQLRGIALGTPSPAGGCDEQ
jgi:hypothetical protein